MKTKKNKTGLKNGLLLFLLSLLAFGYCLFGIYFNVYQYALTGAVFELLWLPMIALIFILPILALVFMVIEKFIKSWYYILTILVSTATILLLFLKK